jgi:hypothetical protein
LLGGPGLFSKAFSTSTVWTTSRVAYRVLQAGDTTSGIWGASPNGVHGLIGVVYRNATIGQVAGATKQYSTSAPIAFPALPSLVNGSWVAGLATPAGTTATGLFPRPVTAAPLGAGSMTALDTDGGVPSWASHPSQTGAQHAFSVELKGAP